MTAIHDVIGKVSYNGQHGFLFTDSGELVKFGNRRYECTVRKAAIEAVEYRVFRNRWALFYAVFILAVFVLRFVMAPEELFRQLAGYWGQNLQLVLWGIGVSGLAGFLAYLYPNSKLVIHAGSFKCVIDGPDEKLVQIGNRMQRL